MPLLLIITAVAAISLLNYSRIHPSIFADEFTYSRYSRLISFSDATLPSYLFFLTYKSTNYCGDYFYSCSKLINIALYCLSIPFFYLVSRKFLSRGPALLTAGLVFLGNFSLYTSFFMPEAQYFFAFWVLTWFVSSYYSEIRPIIFWSIVGVILGLASLVKPHALFLLASLTAFLVFVEFCRYAGQREVGIGKRAGKALKYLVIFLLSAIATKMLVGLLIAGPSALTFFGKFYGSHAPATNPDYSGLVRGFLTSLSGHALVIALLYGFPLLVCVNNVVRLLRSPSVQDTNGIMALYATLILTCLVFVAAMFTASVAQIGLDNLYRLHMRYYYFIFPLLIVLAAGEMVNDRESSGSIIVTVVAVAALAASYVAYSSKVQPFISNFFDSPDVRAYLVSRYLGVYLFAGSAVTILIYLIHRQVAAILYLVAYLPLATLGSAYVIQHDLRTLTSLDSNDKAGLFAKQLLSPHEIDRLLVVGSDLGAVFRTMFYLDRPKVEFRTLGSSEYLNLDALDVKNEWVLALGDKIERSDNFHMFELPGFTLARRLGDRRLDLSKGSWPGLVSSIRGLSFAEAWGRWSDGDRIVIRFSSPLPSSFSLSLSGVAFGPNVGEPINVAVGSMAVDFFFTADAVERIVKFENPHNSDEISIKIPKPTAPRDLGLSDDSRRLGIGLSTIRIIE